MFDPVSVLLALALGYAIGSIPFGLLLTKAAGLGDVRKIGSGNIGATNVLRTGNKALAAATLLLDLFKGLVPVLLAGAIWGSLDAGQHLRALDPSASGWPIYASPEAAAALGAVLGHCFPVWLKFKGGKGVATNAGVSFGLGWPIGLAYALIWIAMLAIFRISSLAGMSAVVAAAIAAGVFGYAAFVPVLALIALLIIWLHRANIARLMQGTEPKVGSKE
ncbi:glycerol-3-phosphate 1-O-acyltransferase PlsY [Qipengyuania nanhaisediminis]|uniref:glycerol-3-phosphate 1-O-acyltransferase PlsY n=1 Tax=Qipengyuania nanhaisediminis TaxID=604088 RepID=UPI0038B3956F